MASVVGTALVVDLVDPPQDPSVRTLVDVFKSGPSLSELSPGRSGVALIHGTGLATSEVASAVTELATSWPAVVVRVPNTDFGWPTVPLVPLYPGLLSPRTEKPSVWQPIGGRKQAPGPGPVLPRLQSRVVRQLLRGRLPSRSRWTRAWIDVWEMPWA